jgi:glycosyltransferase involved in cell wall biosynthesis
VRIVHFISEITLEHGGVVRAVLDLCAALASAGHEVEILCIDDADAPAAWRSHAQHAAQPTPPAAAQPVPRLVRIGGPRLKASALTPDQMARIRARIATADVVHLHVVWQVASAQIAAACRRLKTPYIISPHGMLDTWCMAQRAVRKRLFLLGSMSRTLDRAAFVHCTATAELEQARAWIGRGRGRVVPLVMDLAPFQQLPGPELARSRLVPTPEGDTRPIVLFLSRLHYKKGVERLIEAAAILKGNARQAPFRTLIAGSGDQTYQQRLRDLVAHHGLGEDVAFLGHVGGAEKVSLLQCAALCVLPTSQENFGFACFEALASGTPLLTTTGVDTRPELEASGGALIVEPTAAAIATGVRTLLADPNALQEMGARGRAWVLRELEPTGVVERFAAMYRAACTPGRGV